MGSRSCCAFFSRLAAAALLAALLAGSSATSSSARSGAASSLRPTSSAHAARCPRRLRVQLPAGSRCKRVSALGLGLVLPPRVELDGAYTSEFLLPRQASNSFAFDTVTGYYTLLVAFTHGLTTDATVGTRRPVMQYQEPGLLVPGNPSFGIPSFVGQGASDSRLYSWSTSVQGVDGGVNGYVTTTLPVLLVPPRTHVVLTVFNFVGAGDTVSASAYVRTALFSLSGPPQGQLLQPVAAAAGPLEFGAAP